jgi:mono/diheme cytochrome c family protein
VRERLAKVFAVGLATLVVGLAAWFAARQNAVVPSGRPAEAGARGAAVTEPVAGGAVAPPAASVDPALVSRGRSVFQEQGCVRCHRLDGSGNPRSPLDGVGARLNEERIRDFVIAADDLRETLTPSVVRTKARFRDLPASDLDALVAYLAASR